MSLCECGCGQETDLATYTCTARGYVKGQPLRFRKGHRPDQTKPFAKRFWSHVDKRGADECWLWNGYLKHGRQGSVLLSGHTHRPVQRVAYELTIGPIPPGHFVLHHCGNGHCCNPAHLYLSDALPSRDTFWSFVAVGSKDDCWIWTGRKHSGGYGSLMIDGQWLTSHRLAYELTHGQIPTGMYICHRCNNPPCCNPAHLYAGTAKDNADDCMRAGRFSRAPRFYGERHPASKLTAETVDRIRDIYAAGQCSQRKLANMFGIVQSQVWRIVHHLSWTHRL